MTQLVLIAALARNGVIGAGNRMPWHLSEDLKHFKRTTLGCPVIMGRKTFESIGRPLPGRRNIVVTRNTLWRGSGCEAAPSLDAALALVAEAPRVFVIGGGELYALALPKAEELVLTEIDAAFEGDTVFPPFRDRFVEVAREAGGENGLRFDFVTYRRKD